MRDDRRTDRAAPGEGVWQQRQIIAVLRNYTPVLKLEQAMWERFGERLDEDEKLTPLGPN